jgi:protein O-mannosyl-transferase
MLSLATYRWWYSPRGQRIEPLMMSNAPPRNPKVGSASKSGAKLPLSQSQQQAVGRWRWNWNIAAILLLGAALWLVYGRAISSPFIYDNRYSVLENPSIVRLWPLLADTGVPAPLNPPTQFPTCGRPLVNLSLALNYYFGQLDPYGYHLFNLMLHVLNAMLLGVIVRRTLRSEYFAHRFDRASGPLALIVALLWALHPLQTETVIYVTQRTELMTGFFYLSTMYGSMRYWAASSCAARITWLAISTVACLAGMACKEVMVSAPLVVLLFERTFLTKSFKQALRRSWPLYVALATSWILLGALNFYGPRSDSAGFHLGVPAYVWWFTQSKVLLIYLKLVLWPWPLLIHYEFPYLDSFAVAWPWLLSTLLLAIITFVLLWRRLAAGYVGAWVFVVLLPTLVVPIVTEVAAERRMYLPLAAIMALVVVAVYWLAQWTAQRLRSLPEGKVSSGRPMVLVALGSLALAVVLGLVSVRRLAAYQTSFALWTDNLTHQPDDSTAYNELGYSLLQSRQPEAALTHLQKAVQLNPKNVEAFNNLGAALLNLGRPQEAIQPLEQGLRLQPNNPGKLFNLGNAYARVGQPQPAMEHYRAALRLKPDFAEANNNLAWMLVNAGERQAALEYYQRAVAVKPELANTQSNLGRLLDELGRSQEAIEPLELALKLKPNFAEAHFNLGNALGHLGQSQAAIEHFKIAIDIAKSQGDARHRFNSLKFG